MDSTPLRKCAACQSTNLEYGTLGVHRHTFVPQAKTMWVGYNVAAYVCLDCGTVGTYVQDKDLQTLRDEQRRKK